MPRLPKKTALITVGATTTFTPLLFSALSIPFLSSLKRHGYTRLILQCGPDKPRVDSLVAVLRRSSGPVAGLSQGERLTDGLEIETHALVPSLASLVRPCCSPSCEEEECEPKVAGEREERQGEAVSSKSERGVVIAAAGTGTIIDVLGLGARLIAVPNRELKDDHQVETAEEFARRGLVISGDVGNLVEALDYSERTTILRPTQGEEQKVRETSMNLMDVIGALALSSSSPEEFLRQVNDENKYRRVT